MKIVLEITEVDPWILQATMLSEVELATAIMKELAQVHNARRIELIDRMKAKSVYPSLPYRHEWSVEA